MRNIYDLCNDIQTDMKNYTITEVRPLEKKRMKQYLRQQIQPKHKCKKIAGIACVVLLATIVMFPGPGQEIAYAAGEGLAYHISNFMGLNQNLQDYATVIGTSQTDNGYTIRLNEAILDQGSLVISTSLYKEEFAAEDIENWHMVVPTGDLYVNGKRIWGGASGGAGLEEDHSISTVMRYDLDGIDTTGELNIKLVYRHIGLPDDEVSGKWQFHFTANGAALAADTVQIPIEKTFTLENGVTVTLTYYTGNALGQRVYYTTEGGTAEERGLYMLRLQGTDDNGQKIIFETYRANAKEGTGYMICEILGAAITEQTKWLNLMLYAAEIPQESGRMNSDYQPVGETFHIDLQ